MKITAIKQQVKRPGRFSIFVDEKYAFSLSESALLDQRITIGQEISAADLDGYKEASRFDKAYNLVLAYIARRPRSVWELRDYFRRKDIDEEAGEQMIVRLKGFGYVDDKAFARSWVESRRLLKPISRRRLMLELRQKRVADDIIHAVLEEDETADRDTLAALIVRKRKQTRYQDDLKLMQYLVRQGYSYEDVKSALQNVESD